MMGMILSGRSSSSFADRTTHIRTTPQRVQNMFPLFFVFLVYFFKVLLNPTYLYLSLLMFTLFLLIELII